MFERVLKTPLNVNHRPIKVNPAFSYLSPDHIFLSFITSSNILIISQRIFIISDLKVFSFFMITWQSFSEMCVQEMFEMMICHTSSSCRIPQELLKWDLITWGTMVNTRIIQTFIYFSLDFISTVCFFILVVNRTKLSIDRETKTSKITDLILISAKPFNNTTLVCTVYLRWIYEWVICNYSVYAISNSLQITN